MIQECLQSFLFLRCFILKLCLKMQPTGLWDAHALHQICALIYTMTHVSLLRMQQEHFVFPKITGSLFAMRTMLGWPQNARLRRHRIGVNNVGVGLTKIIATLEKRKYQNLMFFVLMHYTIF